VGRGGGGARVGIVGRRERGKRWRAVWEEIGGSGGHKGRR